jgi:hypothetical protein
VTLSRWRITGSSSGLRYALAEYALQRWLNTRSSKVYYFCNRGWAKAFDLKPENFVEATRSA